MQVFADVPGVEFSPIPLCAQPRGWGAEGCRGSILRGGLPLAFDRYGGLIGGQPGRVDDQMPRHFGSPIPAGALCRKNNCAALLYSATNLLRNDTLRG